jgi:hypothetical protein
MHPMERLRYVARSGGGDPTVILAETVEAIARLRPTPSELVPLCRNLVDRNPTCGPLWWLCAHLLANPDEVERGWRLIEEIDCDVTASHLAERLPAGSRVVTVGSPTTVAQALHRAGEVSVLAVLAGDEGHRLVRAMDRVGVGVEPVAPEAILVALGHADLLLVEAEACSTADVVASMGSGLAAVAASAVGVPVWLVAGRGRRLPAGYVETIVGSLPGESEVFDTACVSHVAGPDGVTSMTPDALAAECPAVPELLPGR